MPFTLSHAAAVLPGLRRDGSARGPLLASALVMGSFAPDMTYFAASVIPGAMEFGDVTHAVPGLLTVDVAITAALVAVWLVVREPLVALLPRRRQGRVLGAVRGQAPEGTLGRWLALRFYVSAVLGASTHIVWDAFTHHDRWGTRMLPVLSETAAGLPVYSYAQYGSSALALAALVWFVVSALRRHPAVAAPVSVPVLDRRGRWLAGALLGACMLIGVAHRCARWYAYTGRVDSPLDIIPTACFGAGAGLAAGLVLYGAGMRLRGRTRTTRTPPQQPLERPRETSR
ncbi:DUF4184 family protein [Streptomyces sp. NBC_01142]|uniref:DUF4184 family protein n=1 Tax=Streptomyces sp. NBC_01142 TaxID=2975865 RepID=UPI00224C84AD|nr:DUF4184 family protein [Streptomyces sp. NBC_01142]MCX4822345.1 DUF4184 family protein [Streptomyces sp. NBC_01142]